MSAEFSAWAKRLRQHLRSIGLTEFKLSHAQEVLATGLGHNTLASLQQRDIGHLGLAHKILLDPEMMCSRLSRFGFDLPNLAMLQCIEDLTTGRQNILDAVKGLPPPADSDGRITPSTHGPYLTRVAFDDANHPLRHEFAREKKGTPENAMCTPLDPTTTLADARGSWDWPVKGVLRCVDARTGWALPVQGLVQFPLLGRHLLGRGAVVALAASGAPYEDDWDDLDGGDVYWHDNSD
jgi:hypothetical protein